VIGWQLVTGAADADEADLAVADATPKLRVFLTVNQKPTSTVVFTGGRVAAWDSFTADLDSSDSGFTFKIPVTVEQKPTRTLSEA